ncbi:hypothetical protein TNCV_3043411 [Trichonephila clavipes]|nr:hypothetical protein TNCV_3043411 [Trichonephila clavipes]
MIVRSVFCYSAYRKKNMLNKVGVDFILSKDIYGILKGHGSVVVKRQWTRDLRVMSWSPVLLNTRQAEGAEDVKNVKDQSHLVGVV